MEEGKGKIPAPGQPRGWHSRVTVIPPGAGTGQGGAMQAAASLRYRDNGAGTITRLSTGLMWGKKDGLDSPPNFSNLHDADNTSTWSSFGAPCNVSSGSVANTGSAAGCVSDVGAFDMVGNVDQWVADWVPRSTACPGWGGFSDDLMCLAGASTTDVPGALLRGGHFGRGSDAGVFAVNGEFTLLAGVNAVGFRAAR